MSSKMVRLHRVAKKYAPGRVALQDISFELNRGEFAYITGGNGAGKTTLLKLLFATERASQGSIVVGNRDLSTLRDNKVYLYRREVGFVFQDFKLLPDLTIYENVALPLEIMKMSARETDFRVRGVLALVSLEDRANDYPQTLSGGEQQRVAIARSMVGKPALLLADEPTGNLDSRTSREILTLFNEIREMGTTVLVATHDETIMQEFPARVIELYGGRIASDTKGS